jgi:hypothetical protein
MLGVILPALVTALVLGICEPAERRLLDGTTLVVAVSLAPVVATADVERPSATAAAQLEQQYVVHPARKDENWTTTSGPDTVARYRLSIRWPYMRVQAPTWTLLRFIRGAELTATDPAARIPGSCPTTTGGPLGTGDPGEDGPNGGRW